MKSISPIQDIGSRSSRFDAPDKTREKGKFASGLYPENLLWAGGLRAALLLLTDAADLARTT